MFVIFFFFQAEDGIRDIGVTGVQTCALPILENVKKEVFGKEAKVMTTPITNRSGKVIGSLSSAIDLGHSSELVKNMDELSESTAQVSESINQMSESAMELADEGQKIGRASCRERV